MWFLPLAWESTRLCSDLVVQGPSTCLCLSLSWLGLGLTLWSGQWLLPDLFLAWVMGNYVVKAKENHCETNNSMLGCQGWGGRCSNLTGKQRETHHDKTHKKIISRGSLEYPASTSYFSQWRIEDVIVAVCTTSLHPAETSQGSQKPSTSGCKGAWEG